MTATWALEQMRQAEIWGVLSLSFSCHIWSIPLEDIFVIPSRGVLVLSVAGECIDGGRIEGLVAPPGPN